jgi:hypothetical protein
VQHVRALLWWHFLPVHDGGFEIQEAHVAVVAQADVARLQVAVDDASLVQRVNGLHESGLRA